ncbi:MAG: hypothetical protein GY805_13210 [Chloroflexi bacterium]|nr:hypothetical protein [Chloroflexota bacterium]
MKQTVRTVTHVMQADFLERIRQNGFLIVLGLTVFMGYLFIPASDAAYVTFVRGFHRGIYNSAWIGILYGAVSVIFLPLFGFFLVKNAIDRDYQTGVGQIIATTPTSKPAYLLGKWLSNLALLALILLVMTGMAVIMQFVRGDETVLNLWAVAAPIWLMGLPVLSAVAAVAVLFEAVSFLRGGAGNIIYFFLFFTVIIGGWLPSFMRVIEPANDFLGMSKPMSDIQQRILDEDPQADLSVGGLIMPKEMFDEATLAEEIELFVWDGIEWGVTIIFERLIWFALTLLIVLLASRPFARFDPAVEQRVMGVGKVNDVVEETAVSPQPKTSVTQLTPLANKTSWRFVSILAAELRLSLKSQKLYWFVGAIGLTIAGFALPIDAALAYLLPAAWIWPLMIWSPLGSREARHHTEKLVFSAAYSLRRQLPATWMAGVLIATLMVSGLLIRLTTAGEWLSLASLSVGILFIPSLALTLGVWSGGSRLFEFVYLLWWYLAFNGVAAFDFMFRLPTMPSIKMPLIYVGGTAVLLILAFTGRWGKVQQ